MRAQSVTDVILGEAVSGPPAKRYEDMKAIASAMVNRARSLGVPLESVVQNQREFNAYNKRLPAGVNAYRSLADQALNEVLTQGPVHNATFYATPAAMDNLPSGLQEVTRTSGHVYFSDPQNRAIGTADGYRRPDPVAAAQYAAINENNIPTPSPSPRGLLSDSFPATPSPVQRGGLLAAPSAPAFDMERFGPAPSTENFDRARFGGTSPNVSYDSMVAQARAAQSPSMVAGNFDNSRFGSATTQPQGVDGLRQGLLASNAQMSAPQGLISSAQASPMPQGPSMASLADQYRQYGVGQAAMQSALAPGVQAQNLALDVADQRAKLGLSPVSQPAQPGYVDPAVTTAQPSIASPAPAMAQPAQASILGQPVGIPASPAQSMTAADAARMERDLKLRGTIGGILGGVLGGGLLGPIGALGGGYFGKQAGLRTYYPDAPQGGTNSKGLSKGELNDRGRDTYQKSGQFRSAVDKGSAGLY